MANTKKPATPIYDRVNFYIDRKQYIILKAKMALKRKSVSAWIREKIAGEVES